MMIVIMPILFSVYKLVFSTEPALKRFSINVSFKVTPYVSSESRYVASKFP